MNRSVLPLGSQIVPIHLTREAIMRDYIKIDPPPNQSTITGLLIPATDGMFVITLRARARSNGHSTPLIWGTIFSNTDKIGHSDRVSWADGEHVIELTSPVEGMKGKVYRLHGTTGNENADTTEITLTIERAM
jgi:hypothetical protein